MRVSTRRRDDEHEGQRHGGPPHLAEPSPDTWAQLRQSATPAAAKHHRERPPAQGVERGAPTPPAISVFTTSSPRPVMSAPPEGQAEHRVDRGVVTRGPGAGVTHAVEHVTVGVTDKAQPEVVGARARMPRTSAGLHREVGVVVADGQREDEQATRAQRPRRLTDGVVDVGCRSRPGAAG